MITEYKLMLDYQGNNHPYLVRENAYHYTSDTLTSPDAIADMLTRCLHLDICAEEYAYLICFDSGGHPLGIFELSHGIVNLTLMNPREIFIRAFLCGAVSISIAHNHPSGLVTPSSDDVKVSQRLKEACDIMGINFLDFIIIGRKNSFYSFLDKKML
ncbi:MAG: JAB domain-containing protein [Clostridiales bacterium]|nr:JAB domain-containing protein [Clostridiales bacterium]